MNHSYILGFIHPDGVSFVMAVLVITLTAIVYRFSCRYFEGEDNYNSILSRIIALSLSVIIMCISDNIFLFIFTWSTNNFILVSLMIRKNWNASYKAGILTFNTLFFSSLMVFIGLLILYFTLNESSISNILAKLDLIPSPIAEIVIIIFSLAAMAQSAIFPFHKWLLSSANAPTPVSALMHAGIVNGGGLLMIRFAPLYMQNHWILNIIFCFGFINVVLGTALKLIQNDYKRTLACSTMAQMGFMVLECGVGIFAAALIHICWHAFFKTYSFLNSGYAIEEVKSIPENFFHSIKFLISIILGLLGCLIFVQISHEKFLMKDTSMVLIVILLITLIQINLTLFQNITLKNLIISVIGITAFSVIYALSINIVYRGVKSMSLFDPIKLNYIHILALFIMFISWLCYSFRSHFIKYFSNSKIINFYYVKLLNMGQPQDSSITTHHNYYQL